MVIGILLVVDDRLVGLAGKVRHIHALRRAEQILKPEIPQKHKQQDGKDADRENAREITHALGPLAPALVCSLRQILTHTEKGVLFLRALPPPLDKRTLLIEVLFAGIERFEHLPRRLSYHKEILPKKQEQIAGRRHARRLLCILTEKRRRTLRIFPKNSGGQLSLVGTLFFC